MSPARLDHSPDLLRLRNDGYDVRISSGYLVLGHVPYLNEGREVKDGTLISDLSLAGDVTDRPQDHVVHFVGDYPCNKDGSPIEQIRHRTGDHQVGDFVAQHAFSSKPPGGYADYYEKMTTYTAIISSPAQAVDPNVTACTFGVVEASHDESPFRYTDTATSRAGISAVSSKLRLACVGIIGLGGSGSYVLDLIAKTPVKEIRLFDGDIFSQHNAFRSPGAAALERLRGRPTKVEYFQAIYSEMHRNIVAMGTFLQPGNLDLLTDMDFAFLCLDKGAPRRPVVEKLEELGTPFVDLGMGIELVDDRLHGVVRVTSSTPEQRDTFRKRVPLSDGEEHDDYASNIQIAELNALNAALAVIRWKKLLGFYGDYEQEHDSEYTIDGNIITNSDMS